MPAATRCQTWRALVVARLWTLSDACNDHAGGDPEAWAECGGEAGMLDDRLTRLGDPALDAWVDGDESILEKLEQERPIPLTGEATAGDNSKKKDTVARAAIVATDNVAEANGDDYLPGL